MGKVFGISNLPVSTIDKTIRSHYILNPRFVGERILVRKKLYNKSDVFINKQNTKPSLKNK